MNEKQRYLKDALALLGKKGENWQKRAYQSTGLNGHTRYCSVGALYAVDGFGSAKHTLDRAARLLREPEFRDSLYLYGAIRYNDSEETQFKDVKKLFKTAIELAGEENS